MAEIEPDTWYAGTWLEYDEYYLPSIFDYVEPAPTVAPMHYFELKDVEEAQDVVDLSSDDEETPEIVQSVEPAEDDDVKNGLDAASLALARALQCENLGLRSRNLASHAYASEMTPDAQQDLAASSPPPKGRKRKIDCADDLDDAASERGDSSASPTPAPAPKKKRKTVVAGPPAPIPAPAPAVQAPPPPPPPPAPRPRQRRGVLAGQPLPAGLQADVNHILALPTKQDGRPSRNKLRKDPALKLEISRKTGHLKTERRGGQLRRWYGDLAVFSEEMWKWLAAEDDDEDDA